MEEDNTSKEDRDERTIVIRNYKDKKFSKDSTVIRKYLKEKYPGMYSHVENARPTPAGSILIEFDDKKTAEEVKNQFDKNDFGGNDGTVKATERPAIGIVKHVYENSSEEDMEEEILNQFPNAKCDFFKNNN